MSPRALIAGAGVGGLATALALSAAGYEVAVFERAAALEEFGAGLQLSPNATRILARYGALEAIRALALAPGAIRLLKGRDDSQLAVLPIADAEARWGAPYLVIHRADLQGALADQAARAPGVSIHLGAELAGLSADESGVAAGLKRGLVSTRETGDVLIGADGLRSRVRERLGLGGRNEALFSGRVAFRATVDAADVDARWLTPEVTLRLGAKAHLVHYPLRHGAVVNLVAVIESGWRGESGDHPWDGVADRPALDRAFADWSPQTRRLLGAAAQWRAWPLYHRLPIASFVNGRVALVGDAAHPMPPFLAQGAAQAIEDAGALGRRLDGASDIAQALAAYSRDRAARAGRVQSEAVAQARVYHMSGPLAFARDMTMRALGPERLLARYDWLYKA